MADIEEDIAVQAEAPELLAPESDSEDRANAACWAHVSSLTDKPAKKSKDS